MSWGTMGDNKQESRKQLPLALCWAGTMHKSQVQSVEQAVMGLGEAEATAGLTFVSLSRAKRFVHLLVEPIPFDTPSASGQTYSIA